MRKFAVALALATTALAGPAFAKDGAFYLGVEGGGMIVEDTKFDIRNAAGTSTTKKAIQLNHDYGFDVDGNVGYDFGAFRTEFEVAYKEARVKSVQVLQGGVPIALANGTVGFPAVGKFSPADGSTQVLSFMVNGLLDFGGKDGGIGGFIGGGVGVARVKYDQPALAKQGSPFINDSDTGFAYQALAGIKMPLSKHVDASLKYRFFTEDSVRTFTTNGLQADSRFRSHSLLVGLTYNFFEDPIPVPPPVPVVAPVAAPLPPCPPAAVTPGPFLVFFDWDKSIVTAEAQAILDRAADQYRATGQTSVVLAGHADKSGTPAYNIGLSQRRADAVKTYMGGKGVPEGVMTTEAFGESRPLVDTADGVREPQNRRVEITFGGVAPVPAYPCTPQ